MGSIGSVLRSGGKGEVRNTGEASTTHIFAVRAALLIRQGREIRDQLFGPYSGVTEGAREGDTAMRPRDGEVNFGGAGH